jgi:CDP-diacylglycerol---serine O-phosphatidyltransferase
MSKLLAENRFFDFSDYGRPIALQIANALKNTPATPVHVTISFVISGLIAIACMLTHHYAAAGLFLILKSILDAADGELARVKNTPSYTGRFLDSNCDIVLNALLLTTICYISHGSWFYTFLAFIGIQLQGTLYNYYYVIIRHKLAGGDTTSRIFEHEVPIAMHGEKQSTVNVLFSIYTVFYGYFDKIIQKLDTKAIESRPFPNWFMSLISLYGLGFQLLIMAVMMALDLMDFIIPFFIFYSLLLGVFIGIRRQFIV